LLHKIWTDSANSWQTKSFRTIHFVCYVFTFSVNSLVHDPAPHNNRVIIQQYKYNTSTHYLLDYFTGALLTDLQNTGPLEVTKLLLCH